MMLFALMAFASPNENKKKLDGPAFRQTSPVKNFDKDLETLRGVRSYVKRSRHVSRAFPEPRRAHRELTGTCRCVG